MTLIDKINILFTGLGKTDSALHKLKTNGNFNLFEFPTIEIYHTNLSLDENYKIKSASKYNYIIFTSANSVIYFLQALGDSGFKVNSGNKIIAIGEKTASTLMKNNIDVDFIPHTASSNSIDKMLSEKLVSGKSVLIPGSTLSGNTLRKSLENKGAVVDFVPIYGNRIPTKLDVEKVNRIKNVPINLYVFTSPSTFLNFIKIFEITDITNYFAAKQIAVIGDVTKSEIEKNNLKVDIIPKEFNLRSLTNEIINFYNKG